MTKPQTEPKDPVWEITKKTAPMSLLLPLLGTGISYAAYADDLAVSGWPWKIGLSVTLLCLFVPLAVSTMYRRTNLLWVYGLILSTGVFAVYFFFGLFAYFFYFVFAPMSPALRWPGLLGGMALTLYWIALSRRTVEHTITSTSFVQKAFDENPSDFRYSPQTGMALFERLNKEPSPFPKIYSYIAFGIAPFCLILGRLLSANFGANGVLLFLAVLGMPVSLWFVGLLVRIYLVMVSLPRRLEREHRKPVLVVLQ
ncbi:hypothetical protein P3T18_000592 [Paraburkholderia sp. GAS199]|uniref:hypothetical protein n=1 Tax=Paraburkholderia sp. GAS199 TaxID=3035126 RepID=UPI003D1C4133